MSDRVFNRLILFSLVFVLFAGFWLRASGLEQYPPGISNDEAHNLIDSAYIAQTGRFPFYQDEGRPEPINRIVAPVASILYGSSVWAFRLTSAFWGLLALSATYWTTTQCFADTTPHIRKLAGLSATVALAVALGHITVTRSIYRAVPLPFFILLAIGFTVRGLRTYQWRDYLWVGIFLALGIYTYTSGFIVPVVFIPLGIILLMFKRTQWRKWLPRLIFTSVVLAILTSPIIYLLATQPTAVLARASDVAEQGNIDLARKIDLMIRQFFTEGDENPQYNVANAPVIAPIFVPLFFIGLGTLILRIRQPSSVIIGGLFLLNMIPVLLTNEITHGLRIYSEFAIVPLIIGASIVLILTLILRVTNSTVVLYIVFLVILGIGIFQVAESRQTYITFWDDADTEWRMWYIYDRELTHNEWFFRSDKLILTNWIKAQNTPVLVPVEELYRDTQRGMLMSRFAYVDNVDERFQLPENSQVLLPWSLERGDFLIESNHFALLDNNTIYLLEPFTAETQKALVQDIDKANVIENTDSKIPIVGKVLSLPNSISLEYQQPNVTGNPIAIFNDELEILGWYGADTITQSGDYPFTIEWSVNRPVSHEYGAFVQLLTQDWERITGDEQLLLRWLYPTIAWQPEQEIPDIFELSVADNLPAGAYRLVVGVTFVNGGRMPAQSFIGDTADDIATIGWIKVPQQSQPTPPNDAYSVSVTLDEQFRLTHAELEPAVDDQLIVKLYWQSLVHRPNIDATIFVQALGSDESIISQSDIRPWNGQYPTFIWDKDEIVMTEHILELADTKDIKLVAGMYTQPDFTRLTATQNGIPLADNLIPLGYVADLLSK